VYKNFQKVWVLKLTKITTVPIFNNIRKLFLYLQLVAEGMEKHLNRHDEEEKRVRHQGMVLAQTKDGAEKFCDIYNSCSSHRCDSYVGGSPKDVLQKFVNGRIRILVVVGRLQEGFDHNKVSVVGIIRKVKSRVLFTQFVGRAVRKSSIDDHVKAQIVTHRFFNQWDNYNAFDTLAATDPEPEDVEIPSDDPMNSNSKVNGNPMEKGSGNPMEKSPTEKNNGNLMEKGSSNPMEKSPTEESPTEENNGNFMEKGSSNPMEKSPTKENNGSPIEKDHIKEDDANPMDSTEQ